MWYLFGFIFFFILFLILIYIAPIGFEDEEGFHIEQEPPD